MRLAPYIIGLVLLAFLLWPFVARAQDAETLRRQQWIHDNAKDCCPHNRCFPVTARPSVIFWDVLGFRSYVRIGAERRWPFEETFGCAYATSPDTIRCLFRPPPEAS
jgi:hypothetical protein